jgi:putative heme-binding domain-containing protein
VIVSPDRQPVTESARCAAIQAMVRMRYVLPPDVVRLWVTDSSPRVRTAAWRALAYGRFEDKATDPWKELLKANNQDVPDLWQRALGAGELRAKLECVGMNRWPTDSLMESTTQLTAEKLEQTMPVRQLWFWANTRNSQTAKTAANDDLVAAQSLYRSNSVGVNGSLMDELANDLSNADAISTEARVLEALALLQSALGDLRWSVPAQQDISDSTVFDGYRSLFGTTVNDKVAQGWSRWLVKQARDAADKGWREVSVEAIRTLAMIESTEPSVLTFCADQLTDRSHPTSDIHHLIAIARCRGARDQKTTEKVVTSLLSIGDKVRVNGLNTDNAWQSRLVQLFEKLMERDPNLASTMIESPVFGSADHMIWTASLAAPLKEKARAKMGLRMREIEQRQWSTAQLKFVVEKGCDDVMRAAIRDASTEPALRAVAVEVLSAQPTTEDYNVFLEALTSSDRMAWKNAWQGLARFDIGDATKECECLALLLARLRGSADEPANNSVYDRTRRVVSKLGVSKLPAANSWQAFEAVLQKLVSAETWTVVQATRRPAGEWITIVNNSANKVGDASRGKLLYAQAKCAQCHSGQTALGPDLAGIGKRFSRDDLFRSIYEPSRDISDRYRATKVLTSEGQVVVGMTVYDSVDGVTLQTADGSVVRINKDDIEEKATATESIMPVGLLESFTVEQVADLYAFLQTL